MKGDLFTFRVRDIAAFDLGGLGAIEQELAESKEGGIRYARSTLVAHVMAESLEYADIWLRSELARRRATFRALEFSKVQAAPEVYPPHTLRVGYPTRSDSEAEELPRNYLRAPEPKPEPKPHRCTIQMFAMSEIMEWDWTNKERTRKEHVATPDAGIVMRLPSQAISMNAFWQGREDARRGK